MYEAFYNLSNDPFRLLPDPGICFPHRSCAKAWAYLRYALKRGEGIVVITGQPGSGKTTLAERLLGELNPAKTVSVRLIGNDLNATDLLRKLAYALGLPAEGMDRAMLAHRIERYLIELEHSNRRALVLIDEAQTLSHHSLEAMRLLTDLQSRSRPVLQLFLLGQEELEGVMCTPGMEQFQQRVIASCRLERMSLGETKAYLEYRLGHAAWRGDPSINGPAVMAIFRESRGLPRHVNKICSRLLLHGSSEEKHSLNESDVVAVVNDLRHELLTSAIDESVQLASFTEAGFESIYALGLVPDPRPRVDATPARPEAMSAYFLADEEGMPPETPAVPPGARRRPRQGSRANAARYLYRIGHRRPYHVRRWIYRLFTAPWKWAEKARDAVSRVSPSIVDWLVQMAHATRTGAASALAAVQRWIAAHRQDQAWAQSRWTRWPGIALPGLAAVLVLAGIVLVSTDDQAPDALVAGQSAVTAPRTLAREPGSAAEPGPMVLAHAGRYLDLASMENAAAGLDSEGGLAGLDDAAALRFVAGAFGDGTLSLHEVGTGGAGSAPFRQLSGLGGDLRQLVLGQLSGDVSQLLVGTAAKGGSSLDVWTLATVPERAGPTSPARAVTVSSKLLVASEPRIDVTPSMEAAPAAGRAQSGPVADDRIALIVSDEYNAAVDFVRFFPATGGGTDPMTDRPPAQEVQAVVDRSAPDESSPQAMVDASAAETDDTDLAVQNTSYTMPGEQTVEQGAATREGTGPEADRLLGLAEKAYRRDHLMIPEKGSAYAYYREVLALDPDDAEALAGVGRIVDRYGALARWALADDALDKAGLFVARALRLDPDNAVMLGLQNEVEAAVEAVEAAETAEREALAAAEMARIAAELNARQAEIEQPVRKPSSSFQRLMRSLEGL